MKNKILSLFVVGFFVVTLSIFSFSQLVLGVGESGGGGSSGWTPPTQNFPNGNTQPPIDTSNTGQTKAGDLTAKRFSATIQKGPAYTMPSGDYIESGSNTFYVNNAAGSSLNTKNGVQAFHSPGGQVFVGGNVLFLGSQFSVNNATGSIFLKTGIHSFEIFPSGEMKFTGNSANFSEVSKGLILPNKTRVEIGNAVAPGTLTYENGKVYVFTGAPTGGGSGGGEVETLKDVENKFGLGFMKAFAQGVNLGWVEIGGGSSTSSSTIINNFEGGPWVKTMNNMVYTTGTVASVGSQDGPAFLNSTGISGNAIPLGNNWNFTGAGGASAVILNNGAIEFKVSSNTNGGGASQNGLINEASAQTAINWITPLSINAQTGVIKANKLVHLIGSNLRLDETTPGNGGKIESWGQITLQPDNDNSGDANILLNGNTKITASRSIIFDDSAKYSIKNVGGTLQFNSDSVSGLTLGQDGAIGLQGRIFSFGSGFSFVGNLPLASGDKYYFMDYNNPARFMVYTPTTPSYPRCACDRDEWDRDCSSNPMPTKPVEALGALCVDRWNGTSNVPYDVMEIKQGNIPGDKTMVTIGGRVGGNNRAGILNLATTNGPLGGVYLSSDAGSLILSTGRKGDEGEQMVKLNVSNLVMDNGHVNCGPNQFLRINNNKEFYCADLPVSTPAQDFSEAGDRYSIVACNQELEKPLQPISTHFCAYEGFDWNSSSLIGSQMHVSPVTSGANAGKWVLHVKGGNSSSQCVRAWANCFKYRN